MASEYNPDPFMNPLSLDNQKIANRITELAQIVFTAYSSRFELHVFRKGEKPQVTPTGVNSVPGSDQLFVELVRADARSGKLAQLLSGGRA